MISLDARQKKIYTLSLVIFAVILFFSPHRSQLTPYLVDAVHFTKEGYQNLADQIAGFLMTRGLLKASAHPGMIRIGCSSLTPLHCMFGEVFLRTGILHDNGLDAEVSFFEHGSDQSTASRQGRIDVTFSCEDPAILQLVNCPDLMIAGSPGSLGRVALAVPRGSKITDVSQLKGKRILLHTGASSERVIRAWLVGAGLDPDRDVYIERSHDKSMVLADFKKMKADALMTWDPWLSDFLRAGDLRVICEKPFRSVVVVSDQFYRRSPYLLSRYMQALQDALSWASRHEAQVCKWVSNRSGISELSVRDVLRSNEYWGISRAGIIKHGFGLTAEDVSLLRECADFLSHRGDIPGGFNVRRRLINYKN